MAGHKNAETCEGHGLSERAVVIEPRKRFCLSIHYNTEHGWIA
jgi:hypothetical protein